MTLKLNQSAWSVVRPRVTPDPRQAAELERRISALSYTPANGFHRDVRPVRQSGVPASNTPAASR